MDLHLISYNVNGLPWITVPIQTIVAWIVKAGNLAAIQEIWTRHTEWSAAFATHGWSFVHPSREHHIASLFGSGLAFAWPTNRWRLLDARQYPFLDATFFDIFAVKGWFQLELLDPRAGTVFRIVNTHMQSNIDAVEEFNGAHIQSVNRKQANQIVRRLSVQKRLPTLIVGDLNTEICPFSSYGFLNMNMIPTYPPMSRIIDHCACLPEEGWSLQQHHVFDVDWSDHLPVKWHLTIG